MSEFPTEKQENYARIIAKTLDINLPNLKTKESYWNFINKYEIFFKNTINSFDAEDMYGIDESECLGHIPGDA